MPEFQPWPPPEQSFDYAPTGSSAQDAQPWLGREFSGTMRIALLAPFGLRAKGTARARVLPLARALARAGHTVAVMVPPYDSPEDAGRRSVDEGVAVHHVALPPGVQTPPWHWQLGWRLYQAAVQWRPDVVHAFKPKGPSGLAATLFWSRRRGGRPRLVVDSDDWEGPGGWNDNPAAGYSEGQKRFFTWQERYGLSHADAWTVTSACLRERAIAFGARPGDVHVLHNGVAGPVHEEAERVGGRQGAILYTRFAGVRGEDVAAIWVHVREQLPQARLTIVGQGPQGEESNLAGIAGVEAAGWLEPAEAAARFTPASVSIAPWIDSPANRARHSAKILELMAAGLPVVAFDVGEMAATLGPGGVLIPPGDVEGFAAAVVQLLRDEVQAADLGAVARSRVRQHFTWDRLAEMAMAAYGVDR